VILGFYGMLAYGMTRDTFSGVECTSCVTGANAHTLPHLYSATQQLQTLRMMLLREDGDTLQIGEAIPRPWLADGKVVEARNEPTRFGEVSLKLTSAVKKGRINISITPPRRDPPSVIRIHLRHPDFKPIRGVYLDGKPYKRFTGDCIELRGVTGASSVEAVF
jgi:hypothetical protein